MQTRLIAEKSVVEADHILQEFSDENWLRCDYFVDQYVGRDVHRPFWYGQSTLLFGKRDPSYRGFHMVANANNLLNKDLAGVKPGPVCMGQDINEPYPGVEQQEMLTRKCLDVLRLHKLPVHIVTRSTGILRDIDILRELTQNGGCRVTVLIPTLDKKLLMALDPEGPEPPERLDLVSRLREEGITAGIAIIPLIPYAMRPKGIDEMFARARKIDASYVVDRPLTIIEDLREDFFAEIEESTALKRFGPRLRKMYHKRTAPYGKTIQQLNRACFDASMEHGLPRQLPAWKQKDEEAEDGS